MHIAYYAPSWPPAGAANGIVTYVAEMRRQLLDTGHDVSVLSQGRLYRSDGSVHDLDPRAGAPLGIWGRVKRRIDHRRGDLPFTGARLARQLVAARTIAGFDLVEMEESFGWANAARRKLNVPVITRLHGPHFMKYDGHPTRLGQRQARQRIMAEGRAIRRAKAISAPSRSTLSATRQHYGIALPESSVISNPVRPLDIAGRDTSLPETILFVGRFDRAKGADTVVRAFALLAARRKTVRLVMVGPDAAITRSHDAMHSSAYLARHLDADALARVDAMGLLPPERITQLRRRAAVTVVASLSETFSYNAASAMAAGSPLISSDWPGSDELIRDGETGWLTPVGSAEPLADRIEWVLDHPGEAAEVAMAAWRHCRDYFAPEQVGRQTVALYGEVLARHAAGS